jgi:hypothetical protein
MYTPQEPTDRAAAMLDALAKQHSKTEPWLHTAVLDSLAKQHSKTEPAHAAVLDALSKQHSKTEPALERKFPSGATRDKEDLSKLDFEGFMSPVVLERYAQYMNKHRPRPDGSVRESDNWQLGMPLSVYMKSGFRHFFDWWKEHRGHKTSSGVEDALCALIFNAMGYLNELLKAKEKKVGLHE